MEVGNPELVWVDEKCYRRNPAKNDYRVKGAPGIVRSMDMEAACPSGFPNLQQQHSASGNPPHREYDEDTGTGCDPDAPDDGIEDEGTTEYEIEEMNGAGAGFRSKCSIPNTFFAVIIGPKGSVKKRIESETNTKINIPRIGEVGDVVVRGQNKKDIIRARRRLDTITSQARFRREATHFMCFPLNSHSVVQNVQEFKEKVLNELKDEQIRVDEKVFQEPEKIHLTLCVVMLFDPAERKKVEAALENIKPEVIKIASNGNLRFRLQGLEIMNDDPTQVNILFAKCVFPENDTTVQILADFIQDQIQKTGFAKASRLGSVKLHATLMNTRYRNQDKVEGQNSNGRGQRFDKTDSFNAKPILDKFGDYDFGYVEIKEVHLSTRHTKGPDGFYKPSAKFSLKD